MQEQVTQNYRGLKTAVIVMGVLLVSGTAALVAGMIHQAGRISEVFDAPDAPRMIILPPELAGRVAQMTQDGLRLSLLVERNGAQKVVIIDLTSGAVRAVIDPGSPLAP